MDQAVIHRVELLIDDRPHGIDLTGGILHTAVRRHGSVDLWYEPRPENIQHMRRSFQVVATGQPIPTYLGFSGTVSGVHRGTAISPDGALEWHVLESYCPHPLPAPEELTSSTSVVRECPACHVILAGRPGEGWIPV